MHFALFQRTCKQWEEPLRELAVWTDMILRRSRSVSTYMYSM